MSQPPAGNYFIINGDVSSSAALALTYSGANTDVTVTGLVTNVNDNSTWNQVWTVNDFDSITQSVSPLNNGGLQIGMGNNVLVTIPAGNYVWAIDGSNGVYTVQDGQFTVYWDLPTPISGQAVSFNNCSVSANKNWMLVSAPTSA